MAEPSSANAAAAGKEIVIEMSLIQFSNLVADAGTERFDCFRCTLGLRSEHFSPSPDRFAFSVSRACVFV